MKHGRSNGPSRFSTSWQLTSFKSGVGVIWYMHFTDWPTASCLQDSLPHHPCIMVIKLWLWCCKDTLAVHHSHPSTAGWGLVSTKMYPVQWVTFQEDVVRWSFIQNKAIFYEVHFVWSLKSRVLPFPSQSHWLSWWWFWYSPARPFSRNCALFQVGSPVWQYTSALTQGPHHWCS